MSTTEEAKAFTATSTTLNGGPAAPPTFQAGKVVGLNKYLDLGALLFEDCQSFSGMAADQLLEETKKNLCTVYKELFDLKRAQKAQKGGDDEDGEILEYTKSMFSVTLPAPLVVCPREKPIPKEKPLTKWEKFRQERGMPARKKRSRLVFDQATNDWVPRWGPKSIKKIEEKGNWLMVDKPADEVDPFTKKKQEKKLVLEKERLKHLKNQDYANRQMKKSKRDGDNSVVLGKHSH